MTGRRMRWDLIYIFRQESKNRKQGGLSLMVVMIRMLKRRLGVFLRYAGGVAGIAAILEIK